MQLPRSEKPPEQTSIPKSKNLFLVVFVVLHI